MVFISIKTSGNRLAIWPTSEEGCTLHRILIRALEYLSGQESAGDIGTDVRTLLQETELHGEEPAGFDGDCENADAEWHSMLIDLIDSGCMSSAEINRKRKLLTFQGFRDERVVPRVIALETLVGPNVAKMHQLFQRSKAIASLQRLPTSAVDERLALMKKHLGSISFW